MEIFSIKEAIEYLKSGRILKRLGWNNEKMIAQLSDDNLYEVEPFNIQKEDILAEDWTIAEIEEE